MGNKYKRTKSIEQLIKLGFVYDKLNSFSDCGIYKFRFPVYKYKDTTLLDCELIIYDSNSDVRLEIKQSNSNQIYPIFTCPYGNNDILKGIIQRKINNKLRILGIKEVLNND